MRTTARDVPSEQAGVYLNSEGVMMGGRVVLCCCCDGHAFGAAMDMMEEAARKLRRCGSGQLPPEA